MRDDTAHAARPRCSSPGGSANAAAVLVCALLAASLMAGCEGPDAEAAFRRGDYEEALAQWQARADAGDAVAENYLGIHYQFGLGTGRDAVTAAGWYRRAALRGNADAQRNLGTLYRQGIGVAKDNLRAYGWYHYAARQGNRAAVASIESMTGELTPNQIMQARELVGRELGEPGSARPTPTTPATPDQGES